jgi:hypothetical protein
MTRVAVAAALVGFAVPALACDAMKSTHASTTSPSSTAKAGQETQKSQKAEKAKKADTKKEAVASAETKR